MPRRSSSTPAFARNLERIVAAGKCRVHVSAVGVACSVKRNGTVTDATGGVLPGVIVRALHQASGNSFESVTDDLGNYRLLVRVGVYQIAAELAGFTTVNRSALELLVCAIQAYVFALLTTLYLNDAVNLH